MIYPIKLERHFDYPTGFANQATPQGVSLEVE